MTRDDIIRLMQEACDKDKVNAWHNGFWTITQEELERFAALVAAAERETCAELTENMDGGLAYIAAAIRARGNTGIKWEVEP